MTTYSWTIRPMLNLCLNLSIRAKFVALNVESTISYTFKLLIADSEDVDSGNREFLMVQELSNRLMRILVNAPKKSTEVGRVSAVELAADDHVQMAASITHRPFSDPEK